MTGPPPPWSWETPGPEAGAALPNPTRDHSLASAGAREARGGDRRPECWLSGVPVPPRLPRQASATGGAGGPETMGRGRGTSSSLSPRCRAPRGGAGGKERPEPRDAAPSGPGAPGAQRGGTAGERSP